MEIRINGFGQVLLVGFHPRMYRRHIWHYLPIAILVRHQDPGGPATIRNTAQEEQLHVAEGHREDSPDGLMGAEGNLYTAAIVKTGVH